MADPEGFARLGEALREERMKALEENEDAVTNSLLLVNQTLSMLAALTEGIQTPFLCPELVGRLAGMLMTVMTRLGGKSGLELKVRHTHPHAPGHTRTH
jgi:hypothetical protein